MAISPVLAVLHFFLSYDEGDSIAGNVLGRENILTAFEEDLGIPWAFLPKWSVANWEKDYRCPIDIYSKEQKKTTDTIPGRFISENCQLPALAK